MTMLERVKARPFISHDVLLEFEHQARLWGMELSVSGVKDGAYASEITQRAFLVWVHLTNARASEAKADREQIAKEADERIERLCVALGELLATHDEDIGMDEYADDESVGMWGDGKEMALTFGVLRRARAALAEARKP